MTSAILFDRDGTLIVDRPHAAHARAVELMPFARDAVALARAAGLRVGVVTNQPAIGRGDVSRGDVDELHRRVELLAGALDGWFVCPHVPDAGCDCRKPMPGLIAQAAAAFGFDARTCVVVGDIGSDVDAASAIGARSVLVPTPVTLADEVSTAPAVAENVLEAVRSIVEGRV